MHRLSTIPVISSAHIPLKSMDALYVYGDSVPWMTCAPYIYGVFISVPSDSDLDDNKIRCSLLDGLLDVFKWANKGDYKWVHLHVSGDEVPELPLYER